MLIQRNDLDKIMLKEITNVRNERRAFKIQKEGEIEVRIEKGFCPEICDASGDMPHRDAQERELRAYI